MAEPNAVRSDGRAHSLNVTECERWIEYVEGGNLYVNRGTTGAVVRRRALRWMEALERRAHREGGGRQLRELPAQLASVRDVTVALAEPAAAWWHQVASKARDESGLEAERNYVRYRHYLVADRGSH